jgi:hypothetical protein
MSHKIEMLESCQIKKVLIYAVDLDVFCKRLERVYNSSLYVCVYVEWTSSASALTNFGRARPIGACPDGTLAVFDRTTPLIGR